MGPWKVQASGGAPAGWPALHRATASGGAEGVGKAVNQAVVTSLLMIQAFNYVFMQTLLATHPSLLVIK